MIIERVSVKKNIRKEILAENSPNAAHVKEYSSVKINPNRTCRIIFTKMGLILLLPSSEMIDIFSFFMGVKLWQIPLGIVFQND